MVTTRTREIAVRVTLGASRPRVIGMILFDVVKLVAPGVAVGILITGRSCSPRGRDRRQHHRAAGLRRRRRDCDTHRGPRQPRPCTPRRVGPADGGHAIYMRAFKSLLDAVMERRSRQLVEQVSEWLPSEGPVLDLGSGTGHVSAMLQRELGLEVVAADVSDIHVVGPPPVLIADGILPFEDGTFSAALLLFMLAYPKDPAGVLAEVARVTRGPIILVQSLHSGRLGYSWLRVREFLWTIVAFHVSKVIRYIPRKAKFAMETRRFYTVHELQRDVSVAGLRIRSRCERPVLPGRSLVIAGWILKRDE